MADIASAVSPALLGSPGAFDNSVRTSSKHGERSTSKKRHRESNISERVEKKSKKSKGDAVPPVEEVVDIPSDDADASKRKRKSHKSKKTRDLHTDIEISQDDVASTTHFSKPDKDENEGEGEGEGESESRKRSEDKKAHSGKEKKKHKKKSRETQVHIEVPDDDDGDDTSAIHGQPGIVVLKSSRSKTLPGSTTSEHQHQYPFYTQTVSQYLPLHPLGINEPVHGYANQHLEPLLNRYVPSFSGVLLAYRNPRIGEFPGSSSLTEDSAMEATAVLESLNEYAVSFGWLTADIDIFRPSRGAWLEGLVNIQSGGHIGVVCWGKFNASIESGRLPLGWKWVEQHSDEEVEAEDPFETIPPEESHKENTEANDHTEVHATGYWVNAQGTKVAADTPIRFRVKNYEVGSSGDYGYLSIEGTMLTEEEEDNKAQEEMSVLKRKLKHGYAPRRDRKRLLDLSITKFANDDAKELESQKTKA